MDLAPYKRDIDDLINEFVAAESRSFADMKRIWFSKKFTYIYQARPTNPSALFMQSLYAHSIGYLISPDSSLSHRLGGLYSLYCLYETQPFKPPFKIYLSLEELKHVTRLVADAKAMNLSVVHALVRRMLDNKVFLFGFVETNEGLKQKVDELMNLQSSRVQLACEKLFGQSNVEELVHMDMGEEFEVGKLKEVFKDYAESKKTAAMYVDDEDMKGISKHKELIGDKIEKLSDGWVVEREVFYQKTGLNKQVDEQELEKEDEVEDDDNFDQELEQMLSGI